MSKKLYIPEDELQRVWENFKKEITFSRSQDGKFKFEVDPGSDKEKANLIFSPIAYCKMFSLVDEYSTEIEWHGIVSRTNDTSFYVRDILLFPHTVASATVISDQKEYEEWLNNLDDDTFNALRFHGHSHVDMAVSPSSVDMNYRASILKNFGNPTPDDDYFYIFMIVNKSRKFSAQIYDLTNNKLYDTNEIDIDINIDDDNTIKTFIAEAKKLAKQQTYTYPTSGYYGGYKGYQQEINTHSLNTHKPSKNQKNNDEEDYESIYDEVYGRERY